MAIFKSPKNRFSASITTSKPLGRLGNSFSLSAMTIDELKYQINVRYVSQAKRIGASTFVSIKENLKKYPLFDWVEVEKYSE